MKHFVVLLLCAGFLVACGKPGKPNAVPLPAPEAAMPEPDAPDVQPAGASRAPTDADSDAQASPVEPPLMLDFSVPAPAHDEIEHLEQQSKVDIGDVFDKPGKQRPVSISGELLLREEVAGDGKPRTVVDGAQVTLEKPIR